jgi:hypothetical protein
VEILSASLELRVGQHVHDQIQIPGLSRRHARRRLRRARTRARPSPLRESNVDRAVLAVAGRHQTPHRAGIRFLERQIDRRLEVVAALRSRRLPDARVPARAPKNVWKKSENGSPSPNISCISSGVIVR